jgi:hypothetical protein
MLTLYLIGLTSQSLESPRIGLSRPRLWVSFYPAEANQYHLPNHKPFSEHTLQGCTEEVRDDSCQQNSEQHVKKDYYIPSIDFSSPNFIYKWHQNGMNILIHKFRRNSSRDIIILLCGKFYEK